MDPRHGGEVAVEAARDARPIDALRDVLAELGSLAGTDPAEALAGVDDAEALAGVDDAEALAGVDDAGLIDLLQVLRRVRAVTGAVEARVQVAFDTSQRSAAEQRGVPKADRGKGVADQIALARGVSAHRAANDLALARGLVTELPRTLGRLASGGIGEGAALAVAKETVCLMPEDRALVDQRVAPRLRAGTSARRAAAITRAEAARVDAESVTRRIAMAHRDRAVTVRPAPDAMVYLTGLLPVKEGVAAYASLSKHADAQKAAGDARSRGQIMADEFFARLTGISDADLVPVEIQLVMPAEALLATDTPADTSASGPEVAGSPGELPGRIGEHVIPAPLARQIAFIADDKTRRWVRRLFTDPISGQVRAVDERRRYFAGALREAILIRDQACRVCDAAIRDVDHITPHAEGGASSWLNGQGLCQRCNQTKTLPGWRSRAFDVEGSHVTVIRTPTGHRYTSHPPPALPAAPDPPSGDAGCGSQAPPSGPAPPASVTRAGPLHLERRLTRAVDAIWSRAP